MLKIGRLKIEILPKPKKHNPFDIMIQPTADRKITQDKKPLFNGLWTPQMQQDYADYCKALDQGKYYPDPRD